MEEAIETNRAGRRDEPADAAPTEPPIEAIGTVVKNSLLPDVIYESRLMRVQEARAAVKPPEPDLTQLKKKWAIYRLDDLGRRCAEIGSREQLIDGLLPTRSLTVVVGDSGLGKSPLLYQAGLCIASGSHFLGRAVRPGRVLYMDAENGLGDVDELGRRLSSFLGLHEPPDRFIGWNLNDCPSTWDASGGPEAMIRDVQPNLVIIDPATAFWPDIQEKNTDAAQVLKKLRGIMKEVGCGIVLVHHTRKSSEGVIASIADPGVDLRMWFEKARGPRAIINNSDIRLAVDARGGNSPDDTALVIGGFGRVRGKIPLIHVERVVDDDGDPRGYHEMTGLQLLPHDQREPFTRLADVFHFKEARLAYGKGPQTTTDWLGKCQAAGIVKKEDGFYRKL